MRLASARHAPPPLEPAWRPWVRLLETALDAAADPAWAAAVPEPPGVGSAARPAGAPLLHGAVLRPDARRVRRLTRELLRVAADAARGGPDADVPAPRARPPRLDTVALLRAAIVQDAAGIGAIANSAGVDADALGAVAQLAAVPLLHACTARLREHVPDDWMRGYCPICGAWPALAELRGIERSRHLRCGRCAGDWVLPVLHCPFCDEIHHDRLGSLLLEGEEQRRRVDTCESCKGYVKSLTTLRPLAPRALAMEDLETVELDLVAQERGYARPARAAYATEVTVERRGLGTGDSGLEGSHGHATPSRTEVPSPQSPVPSPHD